MYQFEKGKELKNKKNIEKLLSLFHNTTGDVEKYNFCEIQIAENPNYAHYGTRHLELSETNKLEICSCEKQETDSILSFVLKLQNDDIAVEKSYCYDKISKVKSTNTTIKNVCNRELHIDYVSSHLEFGFWKNEFNNIDVYLCSNGWYCEAQWSKIPLVQLGVFNANKTKSMKNYVLGDTGTWPTKSNIPIVIFENKKRGEFVLYNIESNSCWNFEIGDLAEHITMGTDGGNREYNGWTKTLKAGEEYKTVTTIYTAGQNLEEVLNNVIVYKRRNKKRNHATYNNVFYNAYMWLEMECKPSAERVITYAKELKEKNLDIDYFVIDCGWHDDHDDPFYALGEWKESKGRYPEGLKNTLDTIRSLGYKVGLWIEPEVVGAKGDAHLLYDDDCYFQRYGKPIITSNRYHLDFRNKKVIDRLNSVIDRIMDEYKIDYLKMDYNIEGKTGTDYNADNTVAEMEEHCKCVLKWIEDVGNKYPDLIIETCSSGGNRLDNSTMRISDHVSASDQMMFDKTAHIVANIPTVILPEESLNWCYPAAENGMPITNESVCMNMVNGLLNTMLLASRIGNLDAENIKIIDEGIKYYRYLADYKRDALVFYPTGISKWYDKAFSVGLKSKGKAFLAVYQFDGEDIKINLEKYGVKNLKVGYPLSLQTDYSFDGKVLKINAKEYQARVFELEF